MKRAALLLAVLLPLGTGLAQAQSGMGRLFTTPEERRALDANRGKSAGANAGNAASGGDAQGATATVPGLPPDAPGMAPRMAPQATPAGPAGMPPGAAPGMADGPPPGMPAGMAAPPRPGADTPPAPEQLTMNGVVRNSNGRSTVWLNNVPQRGAANKFSNRDSKAVTVTLPSGKRVVLQPGQRYDLADGRVKDIGQ